MSWVGSKLCPSSPGRGDAGQGARRDTGRVLHGEPALIHVHTSLEDRTGHLSQSKTSGW